MTNRLTFQLSFHSPGDAFQDEVKVFLAVNPGEIVQKKVVRKSTCYREYKMLVLPLQDCT
jgi:hypothetical protein